MTQMSIFAYPSYEPGTEPVRKRKERPHPNCYTKGCRNKSCIPGVFE